MTLDSFTRSYIETALWSSTDNSDESGGEPLDSNYSINDIAPATLAEMQADCADFQQANADLLALSEMDDSRAGHNFWLNRNGHGSGFWDEYSAATCGAYKREQEQAIVSRDFSKREGLKQSCNCKYHVCSRLSDASKVYGSYDLYVSDDGQIYGQ